MTRARSAAGGLLKLAITAGALAWVFRAIPLEAALGSLRSARATDAAPALLLLVAMRCVATERMRRLTRAQGVPLSFGRVLEINLASSFYGLVLPGSLSGGVVRWVRLIQAGAAAPRALAAILVDRWLHMAATAAIGLACWLAAGDAPRGIGLLLLALTLALAVFALPALGPPRPRRSPSAAGAGATGWLRSRAAALAEAVGEYGGGARGLLGSAFALSLLAQALGTASFLFFARSLDVDVSLWNLGWARGCLAFAAVLPISLAGLGVREGALLYLLRPLGVSGADAVALSLLDFSGGLLLALAGGVPELRRLRSAS